MFAVLSNRHIISGWEKQLLKYHTPRKKILRMAIQMKISAYLEESIIDDKRGSASVDWKSEKKPSDQSTRCQILGLDLLGHNLFSSRSDDDYSISGSSEVDSVVLIRNKLKSNASVNEKVGTVTADTTESRSETRKNRRRRYTSKRTKNTQERKTKWDYFDSSCSDFSTRDSC